MKKIFSVFYFLFFIFISVKFVLADSSTDNAINYLKSKQDQTGRITGGFSAPSQWSAIAMIANGIDISTIKNPTNSLKDFLLTDIPSSPSSATDWETRILAIVAMGDNPTNFNGINYVANLQNFYSDNQIGDKCSLNDDIFGLLAFVASGTSSDTQIKQNTLSFLIDNQDSTDGGFGYSAPGCAWYSTSADMTGAAIQALLAAKENGLTNDHLDDSISKAKAYLLQNQDSDGGFGYYGLSDTDTTGWVLMAFNALGMKDSSQAVSTRNWLISQQSSSDGGFLAYDYGLSSYVSNSTTTAQALIGLAGKSWIMRIYVPSDTSSPAPSGIPTPTPSSTPTPTPTPTSNSSSSSSSFVCWDRCSVNNECSSGLVCMNADGQNRCVKAECPSNNSCSCATPTPLRPDSVGTSEGQAPTSTPAVLFAQATDKSSEPTVFPTSQPEVLGVEDTKLNNSFQNVALFLLGLLFLGGAGVFYLKYLKR